MWAFNHQYRQGWIGLRRGVWRNAMKSTMSVMSRIGWWSTSAARRSVLGCQESRLGSMGNYPGSILRCQLETVIWISILCIGFNSFALKQHCRTKSHTFMLYPLCLEPGGMAIILESACGSGLTSHSNSIPNSFILSTPSQLSSIRNIIKIPRNP